MSIAAPPFPRSDPLYRLGEGWRRRQLRRQRALSALQAVVTIALVGAWFIFLRPTALGGPASFVLVTGCSMCPTYSPGDVVITERQDAYHRGDIVAYRVPPPDPAAGHIVIHRIVGGSAASGFVMEGDHNHWADPWSPRQSDIVGTAVARLPGAGYALRWVRDPALVAAVASTVAFCAVAFAGERRRRS